MSERSEKAYQLFKEGYNCSQAVLAVFVNDLGMDFETAMKLSSSFGGGMGKLREVCGAVSAMFIVAGLKNGYTSPNAVTEKNDHYALIQQLAKDYEAENGSINCGELLGLKEKRQPPVAELRTEEYYKKRPCADLVKSAVEILEKNL